MKKLIVFTLLFVSIGNCYSQSQQSKKGIKKILTTEMLRELYNDGKYYNSTLETNETFYSEQGDKLKNIRITYDSSEPKNKNTTTYYYNNKSQIDFSITQINEDTFTFKTYYNYSDNLLVKVNFSYKRDEKVFKFEEIYNYTDKSKLISSIYTYYNKYVDSDESSFITYIKLKEKYDRKERTIEMDYSESDSIYEHNRFSYKWKKQGLLSKKEYNKDGKLISKTRFEHVFNDRNHWIIRKAFRNKSLHKTIYREIDYHP